MPSSLAHPRLPISYCSYSRQRSQEWELHGRNAVESTRLWILTVNIIRRTQKWSEIRDSSNLYTAHNSQQQTLPPYLQIRCRFGIHSLHSDNDGGLEYSNTHFKDWWADLPEFCPLRSFLWACSLGRLLRQEIEYKQSELTYQKEHVFIK